jgi:hypothetical protein
VGGVTYDTGALVAAERNNRTMWKVHAGFLDEGIVPVVPAPVLAQAWRGGARQANLTRMLQMCRVEPMSEQLARNIGVLVGQSDHDDVVDAAVVEGAIRRSDAVVTSDANHIRKVASGAGRTLRIQSV